MSVNSIWPKTLEYFGRKDPEAQTPSYKTAAFGFRFGMAVTLRHPEYARAYMSLLALSPLEKDIEDGLVDGFIREIPIHLEGELDVVPPSQQ